MQYPHYDETLLEAFTGRGERFVASTLRRGPSASADLLDADYTFVNERLARHYGIPGIYGNRFRRVPLNDPERRGGLLAAGALLATTSYPDRTSPVLRGKWLVDNIFGTAGAAAAARRVDTDLEEEPGERRRRRCASALRSTGGARSCASCHAVIDPLGFALENFDVIGGWRTIGRKWGRRSTATGTTTAAARRSTGWRACGRCFSTTRSSFRGR